jgi:hypothetical protein
VDRYHTIHFIMPVLGPLSGFYHEIFGVKSQTLTLRWSLLLLYEQYM